MMSRESGIDTSIEQATGTRIAVEIGTPMVLDLPGVEAKIKMVMVGMQPGEYLILKPPRALGVKLFQIGKVPRAIVRYVFAGRVYGFETPMIGAILEPVALVFLSYPKSVYEHNLRAARRIECQLPGKVKLKDGEFGGVVLDLSLSGCRVSIKTAALQSSGVAAPALDSGIGIDIQLPWEAGTLTLNGRIKNIEQDTTRLTFGVAFGEIDGTIKERISSYIAEAY